MAGEKKESKSGKLIITANPDKGNMNVYFIISRFIIFEIFDDKNKKSKCQEKGKLSGKVTERIKCTLCAQ